MPERTDQPQPQPSPTAHLRAQLLTMADRLDHDPAHAPSDPFTPGHHIDLIQDITNGNGQALLDITPPVIPPTTRATYSARLRQIAGIR